MKKKQVNRSEIIEEWLDLYPIRQLPFETDSDGKVTIIVPHNENWFTRKLLPKPKKPAQKIHLDELGSFVWQCCDGNLSIREICAELQSKFQEKAAVAAQERIVLFCQQMYKQNFIKVYSRKTSDESREHQKS